LLVVKKCVISRPDHKNVGLKALKEKRNKRERKEDF